MALEHDDTRAAVDPVALGRALEQSKVVQAKAEACADDIASANDILKKKIAEGALTVSAHKTLSTGAKVESKVQECADDLHDVNDALSEGIDNLKQTEVALAKSRAALADTEAALATAREDEKRARLRAMHDSTTGLPNRGLFDDRLLHAISLAERHNWTLAVMFLDLDGFKRINDTHGHAAGDCVLKAVAKRLLRHCRHEDSVCRNGGDEFLYLLMNPRGIENIGRIADDVLENISQPIDVENLRLVVKPSIGISIYPDNGTTGDQLIKNADAAMYRAKKRMSGYLFFDALKLEKTSA